jgi:CspA family cold shock protein
MTWLVAEESAHLADNILPENAISTACVSAGKQDLFMKGFPMASGTVKWFNFQKGFGFIAPDNGGSDAFVHISAVERAGMSELREGQKVSFELVSDRKSGKMSADNLKALDWCIVGSLRVCRHMARLEL